MNDKSGKALEQSPVRLVPPAAPRAAPDADFSANEKAIVEETTPNPSSGTARTGKPSSPTVAVLRASGDGAGEPTAVARKAADVPAVDAVNLRAPQNFLNRELTWLEYCRRILNEARDARVPLLERVKFLSIVSSNLDEFFMKRIGGLKQQVGAGLYYVTPDGRTPQQQIDECYAVIRGIETERREIFIEIERLLEENGITFRSYAALDDDERKSLRDRYYDNIFPLVTPQAMDPAHPFPFISNLSLNLLVSLHHPGETEDSLVRVKVPVGKGIARFLRIGATDRFIALEDVIAHNLDLLFPGMEISSCRTFRVTRNANTERDEETADDLLALIETELRDRKLAPIVRLQVPREMPETHRGLLSAELGLDRISDVFESDVLLGMRDLMEIAQLDRPELRDPDHHPIDNAKLLDEDNIFHVIRKSGPILLHHPYESFSTSVENFVGEASSDPKVLAIKMTLYRTSAGTRVIEHLVDAARNGKQVAVVMELKARFDEEANIQWARHMEEYGIHVTYGVVGLKTHSKVTLVIRKDYNGLRRYAHIGTGNYHAGTARLYSDLGLLTSDDDIGRGLTELFNYLTTGYKPKREYYKILPAPKVLKKALLTRIEREIDHHKNGSAGLIRLKANALEDEDITVALYKASQAGVKVDLIVRDTCRLRPGIPGLSDNIRVISIVGRFLEHSRIFHFRNGGKDEYFIGSADLMMRNLEHRVEVVVPVEAPALQAELATILDVQLADKRSAWDMRPDGTYIQRRPEDGKEALGSQQVLFRLAEKRHFEATRLRKRKPKGIARRSVR